MRVAQGNEVTDVVHIIWPLVLAVCLCIVICCCCIYCCVCRRRRARDSKRDGETDAEGAVAADDTSSPSSSSNHNAEDELPTYEATTSATKAPNVPVLSTSAEPHEPQGTGPADIVVLIPSPEPSPKLERRTDSYNGTRTYTTVVGPGHSDYDERSDLDGEGRPRCVVPQVEPTRTTLVELGTLRGSYALSGPPHLMRGVSEARRGSFGSQFGRGLSPIARRGSGRRASSRKLKLELEKEMSHREDCTEERRSGTPSVEVPRRERRFGSKFVTLPPSVNLPKPTRQLKAPAKSCKRVPATRVSFMRTSRQRELRTSITEFFNGRPKLDTQRAPPATPIATHPSDRPPLATWGKRRLNHRNAEMHSMRIPPVIEQWWFQRSPDGEQTEESAVTRMIGTLRRSLMRQQV